MHQPAKAAYSAERMRDAAAGASAAFADPPPFAVTAAGHTITVIADGQDRLEKLLGLIGEARSSLRMTFYIFACDRSGTMVRDALVEAARRGVAVVVIVDGFGAEADEAFFAPLTEAGGRFHCFTARRTRRYLIRNHQKIVLADAGNGSGGVAMLGGFNVENSYFEPPARNGWNDLAFRIEGPVVARIDEWFDRLEDWVASDQAQFRDIRRKVGDWKAGEGRVRLLIGGPTERLSSWTRCVAHDFFEGERVDMMMAYFSPWPGLVKRLCRIARKGRTRLIMAGKSDNTATIGASRAIYGRLLKADAKVFEFEPCKLHTKLIVLDDAVYLGSANFDVRSLFINLEIVLRVEDAAFAETMRGFIADHVPHCTEITPKLYKEWSGPFTRLRWLASWFLVSVVDYTVSRKLNLGN